MGPRVRDVGGRRCLRVLSGNNCGQAHASAIHRPRAAQAAPTSRGAGGKSSSGSGGAVTGLLINASDDTPIAQSGAPGLRSAGGDENSARGLAIAFAGLIVALILAGSLLERRRPEAIL